MRFWRPQGDKQTQTVTALAQELRTAVGNDPKTFAANADQFIGLRPIYVRRVLEGLQNGANNEHRKRRHGFSTRALFGRLGDDNFTVKVTPDASTFYTALTIDKSSGKIDHPQGAKFSAKVNFDDYHAAGAWATIGFNNANHNDQNAFSSANSNFVAPVAGYYFFGAHFVFKKNATLPTEVDLAFYLNGSIVTQSEVLTKTIVDLGTFLHTTGVHP